MLWDIPTVAEMSRSLRFEWINEEPRRHFVRGLFFAQDSRIPVFVPVSKSTGSEWTGTAFDCDYHTWVPDCPLEEAPSVLNLTTTTDGGILSTNSDGCLTFVEDRVMDECEERRKYIVFHVPPSAPSYDMCGPNLSFPDLNVKGNVLVIKVMSTPNYPLDMDLGEWNSVFDALELGLLDASFSQKTVLMEKTVVSVARGCSVV